MDFIVIKSTHGYSLENGNTVYVLIHFKPSVNHLNRIQDIGIEIKVNKSSYHSSLMPKIHQLVVEANEELSRLNSEFKGTKLDIFNARVSLPNAAQ